MTHREGLAHQGHGGRRTTRPLSLPKADEQRLIGRRNTHDRRTDIRHALQTRKQTVKIIGVRHNCAIVLDRDPPIAVALDNRLDRAYTLLAARHARPPR